MSVGMLIPIVLFGGLAFYWLFQMRRCRKQFDDEGIPSTRNKQMSLYIWRQRVRIENENWKLSQQLAAEIVEKYLAQLSTANRMVGAVTLEPASEKHIVAEAANFLITKGWEVRFSTPDYMVHSVTVTPVYPRKRLDPPRKYGRHGGVMHWG